MTDEEISKLKKEIAELIDMVRLAPLEPPDWMLEQCDIVEALVEKI